MKFTCKNCSKEKPVWLKTGLCEDCTEALLNLRIKFTNLSDNCKYIVRLYDGFDNYWIDITKALSKAEAIKVWMKETKNGTEHICYGDIDYYDIFQEHTVMVLRG